MKKLFRNIVTAFCTFICFCIVGCSVPSEQLSNTLNSTDSAEQNSEVITEDTELLPKINYQLDIVEQLIVDENNISVWTVDDFTTEGNFVVLPVTIKNRNECPFDVTVTKLLINNIEIECDFFAYVSNNSKCNVEIGIACTSLKENGVFTLEDVKITFLFMNSGLVNSGWCYETEEVQLKVAS